MLPQRSEDRNGREFRGGCLTPLLLPGGHQFILAALCSGGSSGNYKPRSGAHTARHSATGTRDIESPETYIG